MLTVPQSSALKITKALIPLAPVAQYFNPHLDDNEVPKSRYLQPPRFSVLTDDILVFKPSEVSTLIFVITFSGQVYPGWSAIRRRGTSNGWPRAES
jgi:hypothetical protein